MGNDRVENGQYWRKRGSDEVFELSGAEADGRTVVELTSQSNIAASHLVTIDDLLANYERVEA